MYDHGFRHGWMSDTHPEALKVWLELQRRLTPEHKLRQVQEFWEQ